MTGPILTKLEGFNAIIPVKLNTGEAFGRFYLSLLLAIIYVKHLAKSLEHNRHSINGSFCYWYKHLLVLGHLLHNAVFLGILLSMVEEMVELSDSDSNATPYIPSWLDSWP